SSSAFGLGDAGAVRTATHAVVHAAPKMLQPATLRPFMRGSTLRVLEPLASARLTVLLALLLARIACEEAGALEHRALFRVETREGARDAVTHRFGLGVLSAAVHRGNDVELVGRFDELEALAHDHARRRTLEVVVRRNSVHRDLAAAGREPHASDSSLAFAGCVSAVVGRHRLQAFTVSCCGFCAAWG